ncbi:MAG: hypothetical protein NZM27_10075 [Acetobacteraceae bacterium]|nr:hypothetical protein [Acetobacteraceae bacterium]MCX7684312.1 hypothetical protein [Acetobacteraceae bacterium]MDW8397420.1 hypothetical protein [Acetobacteraceae bacterium]
MDRPALARAARTGPEGGAELPAAEAVERTADGPFAAASSGMVPPHRPAEPPSWIGTAPRLSPDGIGALSGHAGPDLRPAGHRLGGAAVAAGRT